MTVMTTPRKPFEPWPFALIVLGVVFVTVQILIIMHVSRGFEGPDDMQYYRHGLEYGKVVKQQERQRELGWRLATNLRAALPAGQVTPLEVTLTDRSGAPLAGASIAMKAGRPATQRDDVRLAMQEVRPGTYAAPLTLGAGVWDLQFTVRHGRETIVEKVRVTAR